MGKTCLPVDRVEVSSAAQVSLVGLAMPAACTLLKNQYAHAGEGVSVPAVTELNPFQAQP